MAYKTFVAGTEGLASDINTYLMNQTVMVFADSTARAAALTTPTEGMVCYLTGNDHLTVYDGSAWQIFDVAWSTYTPTFTNFTLGNGTVIAKYFRVGRVVHVSVNVTLGTTSSVSGVITMSLPVAYASTARFTGYVRMAVGSTFIGSLVASSGNAQLVAHNASGTYVTTTATSATVPGTWASTHSFIAQATYEV